MTFSFLQFDCLRDTLEFTHCTPLDRIASDLLLWEPIAPSPVDRVDPYENSIGTGLDLASQLLQAQAPDKFVMCKSGIRDDGKNFSVT